MRRLYALASAIALLSACASGNDHPPAVEGGIGQDDGGTVIPGVCTSGIEQGCPCGDAGVGATADCQAERFGADAYKSCEPGTRSCGSDGKWGACVGASVWDGGG